MVRIVCGDSRFAPLAPRLRKASNTLLRLTQNKGASFELYVGGDSVSPHTVYAYPAPERFPRPDITGRYLGELYLNPDRIKKEGLPSGALAKEGGDPLAFLIHGFLHLLHYDHERKNDRLLMEREEQRLLKNFSFLHAYHRSRSGHAHHKSRSRRTAQRRHARA